MFQHREDMDCTRVRASLIDYQLDEANHRAIKERANKDASIKKCSCI